MSQTGRSIVTDGSQRSHFHERSPIPIQNDDGSPSLNAVVYTEADARGASHRSHDIDVVIAMAQREKLSTNVSRGSYNGGIPINDIADNLNRFLSSHPVLPSLDKAPHRFG